MDDTSSLVLEHLRYMRAKLDNLALDVSEVKGRLSQVEMTLSRQQFSIDRIDARVERIERRLDLVHEG